MQVFEARLTAVLATRSGLLPRVLAVDEERAWLLLADAGTPLSPFGVSLVSTLHHERDRVPFERLRDAYLEPWGGDIDTFELALRVGWGAYAVARLRQYDHLRSEAERADFRHALAGVLEHAHSAAA